jgi:hypothetical protein
MHVAMSFARRKHTKACANVARGMGIFHCCIMKRLNKIESAVFIFLSAFICVEAQIYERSVSLYWDLTVHVCMCTFNIVLSLCINIISNSPLSLFLSLSLSFFCVLVLFQTLRSLSLSLSLSLRQNKQYYKCSLITNYIY